MSAYSDINKNICVECGGTLISTSDLNHIRKECTNCGEKYYHPDDMGPGCWQHGGGNPKKQKTNSQT